MNRSRVTAARTNGALQTAVLDSIFTQHDCGDGVCAAPDEYPTFQAADDARQFVGCRADCGLARAATVTVSFFDAWKLKRAHELMEARGRDAVLCCFSFCFICFSTWPVVGAGGSGLLRFW